MIWRKDLVVMNVGYGTAIQELRYGNPVARQAWPEGEYMRLEYENRVPKFTKWRGGSRVGDYSPTVEDQLARDWAKVKNEALQGGAES